MTSRFEGAGAGLVWAMTLVVSLCGGAMQAAAADEFGGGGGAVGGDVAKFAKELKNHPAMHVAHPEHAAMIAAARAGSRTVAVGDHGTILLSDDDGKSWRQAKDVPTRVMMNSVCFVDDKQGWAAGHWGEILHTADGGETWTLQRMDTTVDQPLFSIHFSDASHGLVVGLWSLALLTSDGGATWTTIKMPALSEKEKAGPNLYQIVPGTGGTIYIAAEQGLVFKSTDGGQAWTILESGTTASITSLALTPQGGVEAAGLEGATLSSKDGITFTSAPRADRAPMTAVVIGAKGGVELFSKDGPIPGP